eukprot:scaffold143468_cov19-Tisochrysis_lutea.AAC.1
MQLAGLGNMAARTARHAAACPPVGPSQLQDTAAGKMFAAATREQTSISLGRALNPCARNHAADLEAKCIAGNCKQAYCGEALQSMSA